MAVAGSHILGLILVVIAEDTIVVLLDDGADIGLMHISSSMTSGCLASTRLGDRFEHCGCKKVSLVLLHFPYFLHQCLICSKLLLVWC